MVMKTYIYHINNAQVITQNKVTKPNMYQNVLPVRLDDDAFVPSLEFLEFSSIYTSNAVSTSTFIPNAPKTKAPQAATQLIEEMINSKRNKLLRDISNCSRILFDNEASSISNDFRYKISYDKKI